MFFNQDNCPGCMQKGSKIQSDTMIHHVKDISKMGNNGYSFCHSPECNVVYFKDEEVFTTDMINKEIGLKDSASERGVICFCYNYFKSELYEPSLIDKINIRIDNYGSRCDLRNPAGRCCLKDIKRVQTENRGNRFNNNFRVK
ncbi:MAG: hypothetical protein U9R27_03170 [Campylobacterota bacterium]|nr:hypothetical protein [Campylobacterota bacterium]